MSIKTPPIVLDLLFLCFMLSSYSLSLIIWTFSVRLFDSSLLKTKIFGRRSSSGTDLKKLSSCYLKISLELVFLRFIGNKLKVLDHLVREIPSKDFISSFGLTDLSLLWVMPFRFEIPFKIMIKTNKATFYQQYLWCSFGYHLDFLLFCLLIPSQSKSKIQYSDKLCFEFPSFNWQLKRIIQSKTLSHKSYYFFCL